MTSLPGARLALAVVDVTADLYYDGQRAKDSGFVVDGPAALVLTSNHVIKDATSIMVTSTPAGESYRAAGTGPGADVTALRLADAPGWPPPRRRAPRLRGRPGGRHADGRASAYGRPCAIIEDGISDDTMRLTKGRPSNPKRALRLSSA